MSADLSQFKRIAASLRAMPTVVAQDVASKVAPDFASLARNAFESGKTVYGDSRREGADGHALSLRRTGRLFGTVRFVSIGTRVRCVLGVPYARYNIRFGILPRPNAKIPTAWSDAVKRRAESAIAKAVA